MEAGQVKVGRGVGQGGRGAVDLGRHQGRSVGVLVGIEEDVPAVILIVTRGGFSRRFVARFYGKSGLLAGTAIRLEGEDIRACKPLDIKVSILVVHGGVVSMLRQVMIRGQWLHIILPT